MRTHPYVRLARDARFSAFWIGQTISAFGDKLNQIALAWLDRGDAPIRRALSGLVFVAAMLPNLLLGPIAGTLVDRWDQKRVMVASDLLRAALVLLHAPSRYSANVALVYPLVFLITTVSLFFRPARAAVLPRIVQEDDLLAANSAMWTGETLMEVAGYPIAGVLVGVPGRQRALAFWIDSATYVVSAILIAGIVDPAGRHGSWGHAWAAPSARSWASCAMAGGSCARAHRCSRTRSSASWGSSSAGADDRAHGVLREGAAGRPGGRRSHRGPQVFAAIEAAIGLGNLVGGIRGRGSSASGCARAAWSSRGFVLMGVATIALGLAGSTAARHRRCARRGRLQPASGWFPRRRCSVSWYRSELMGRVISIRGSLVFGAMTISAAVCSAAAAAVPAGTVLRGAGRRDRPRGGHRGVPAGRPGHLSVRALSSATVQTETATLLAVLAAPIAVLAVVLAVAVLLLRCGTLDGAWSGTA